MICNYPEVGGSIQRLLGENDLLFPKSGIQVDTTGFNIKSVFYFFNYRALQFVYVFLSNLVQEYRKGKQQENLQPHIQKAYDETLHRYHNYLTQKMFKVIFFFIYSIFIYFTSSQLGYEYAPKESILDIILKCI